MAETYDGRSWLPETIPASEEGSSLDLASVSCTAANACTAVGTEIEPEWETELVAAVRWNGSSWSAQATPEPSPSLGSRLEGVSCWSSSGCIAVGTNSVEAPASSQAIAMIWNGTEWKAQTVPNPVGGTLTELHSVSCTSSSFCIAVGNYTVGGKNVPLAEVWNGTEWKVQTTPNPPVLEANPVQAKGVSCVSSSFCEMVGYYVGESGKFEPFAETWNGTEWKLQAVTPPTGFKRAELLGVSCTATNSCHAVGTYNDSANNPKTLATSWNGTSWLVTESATPSGATSVRLAGASCVAANDCHAVGAYNGNTALTEKFAQWSAQTVPMPGGASVLTLDAVSCTAANACTAVGGTGSVAAVRWNGTAWSVQTTPKPSPTLGSGLQGVSCWSSTGCIAVGRNSVESPTFGQAIAMIWNGSEWKAQTVPQPAGGTFVEFRDVSCVSSTFCIASGNYAAGGKNRVLAAVWDGTEWKLQTIPNPPVLGINSVRGDGVSCVSTTFCEIVGYYVGESGKFEPFAEAWDGTEWKLQSVPSPAGFKRSELWGVSCTASNACHAVGTYEDSEKAQKTLAAKWDGTSWSVTNSVTPAGVTNLARLTGVSCVAANDCHAVGVYNFDTVITQRWDGTEWSLTTSVNPKPSAGFAGVSCVSSTLCEAVGNQGTGLAEVYTG